MAQRWGDIHLEGDVDSEYESILQNVYHTPAEERLIFAILQKNPKRVKYLVEQGANVNCISEESEWTPLMLATMTGVTQTVHILLNNGADPNYYSGQYTPLMVLCKAQIYDDIQSVECFNLLVKAGANINAVNYNSMTPLMLAATADNSHLVACLLSHGADLDAVADNGWSAMFYAVSFRHLEVIRVLKRAGSNLSLRDKNGSTIGDLAFGNDSIFKILNAQKNDYHFNLKAEALNNRNLLNVPMSGAVYYGFCEEVLKTLRTIGLKYLIPLFMEKKIGYGQFLFFNNEEWKKMGVQFAHDRQKLICNANHLLQHCWSGGILQQLENNDLERFWLQLIMAKIKD